MSLDEQTKDDAARWRAMRNAIEGKVREYESAYRVWTSAKTSWEAAVAFDAMSRNAREVTGFMALVLGVKP